MEVLLKILMKIGFELFAIWSGLKKLADWNAVACFDLIKDASQSSSLTWFSIVTVKFIILSKLSTLILFLKLKSKSVDKFFFKVQI